MPKFGKRSKEKLSQCDERLQRLFNKVIESYDCSILEGHRSESRQNEMFQTFKSKLKWPHSKHNKNPSMAVDAAPYPIDWNDLNRFYHFAGFVRATAIEMGLNIRWGGDWDNDLEFSDQSFNDLPHFELVDECH